MGVGAIFVSTLALSRLPTPHSPPANQQELLAATLQTLVSFVVLGSIVIRKSTRTNPDPRRLTSVRPPILRRFVHPVPLTD